MDKLLLVPTIRYQYRDHLGSSVIEANEHGQVISYEEYYPYGSSAYRASSSNTDLSLKRYRFTDKEKDDETGLYYFGVRYYMPWLGRWTAADPGGFVDGVNLYRYVRNNPVNGVDEMGYNTDPPPTCPDPPCGDTAYSLPTVDINIPRDAELDSYYANIMNSTGALTTDAYQTNFEITSTSLLTAKGGSPYRLGYLWNDREDYFADWFVYNSLQRPEVVAMGRFEYYGEEEKMYNDSQTNIVITVEEYFVSYTNDEGEYIPKERRYKFLYSIFNRASSKPLDITPFTTNLTYEEIANLDQISGSYTIGEIDLPGKGLATKGIKGGIRLMGTGGSAYGLYARGAKTLNNWRKKLHFAVNDSDLLNKGFHLHFDEMKGMELGLRPGDNGKVLLSIVGKKSPFNSQDLKKGVDLFGQAMNDRSFQNQLIQRLMDSQLYAIQKAKLLKGSDEAARWLNYAHETNFLIKSFVKDYRF